MTQKTQQKLITFSLILAILGVTSSFCSFLLVMPAEASGMGCHDRNMVMFSGKTETGTVMACCAEKNSSTNSDISNTSVKISKLEICQNISVENNLGNNFQNSQITLSSSNSPPGEALLTVSKKE